MAKAVTQQEIELMNTLYLELKTYSAVAKEVGRAASTVKKYIVPNFRPVENTAKEFDITAFDKVVKSAQPDSTIASCLNAEERENMKQLWEVLAIWKHINNMFKHLRITAHI